MQDYAVAACTHRAVRSSRRTRGRRDAPFNLGDDHPTHVLATVRVHLRCLYAILGAAQVVGKDHTQPFGDRLVQRSKLPQVLDGLGKSPIVASALTSIECSKANESHVSGPVAPERFLGLHK